MCLLGIFQWMPRKPRRLEHPGSRLWQDRHWWIPFESIQSKKENPEEWQVLQMMIYSYSNLVSRNLAAATYQS